MRRRSGSPETAGISCALFRFEHTVPSEVETFQTLLANDGSISRNADPRPLCGWRDVGWWIEVPEDERKQTSREQQFVEIQTRAARNRRLAADHFAVPPHHCYARPSARDSLRLAVDDPA